MTTLYRPVLIQSVEQAETLPIGTVGHEPPHLYAYVKRGWNLWSETGHDQSLTDYEMLPFTALVPIEAEEERMAAYVGESEWEPDWRDGQEVARLTTPWTPVSD